MFVQEKFEIGDLKLEFKRIRPNNPSFRKEDKIKKLLEEWNTIEDIELYENLYILCSQLFYATQDKKLACLNYYIDHERDSETGEEYTVQYAEIQDTWLLPMKERYNQHRELLKRVMSNDTTLIYCDSVINKDAQDDEKLGQLSLFE